MSTEAQTEIVDLLKHARWRPLHAEAWSRALAPSDLIELRPNGGNRSVRWVDGQGR